MKHKRPIFPSTDDLCDLSLDDARAALAALQFLVDAELATVYTSAGSQDTHWQVWSELQRRRIELATWAAEWIAERDAAPSGGAA